MKKFRSYYYTLKEQYPKVEFEVSTVDVNQQKSVNYIIKFWKKDPEVYDKRSTQLLLTKIRNEIYLKQSKFLKDRFITNTYYPEVCVNNKEYFVSEEFTFFKSKDFKHSEITTYFTDLSKHLYFKFFDNDVRVTRKKRKRNESKS